MNKNILEEAERGRHKCKCGSLVFHLGSLAIKKHPDREDLKHFTHVAVCANRDCQEMYLHHSSVEKWVKISDDLKRYLSEDLMTYIIQPETLDFAELQQQRVINSVLDTMVTT